MFLQSEIRCLVVNAMRMGAYFLTSGDYKYCRSDSLGFWWQGMLHFYSVSCQPRLLPVIKGVLCQCKIKVYVIKLVYQMQNLQSQLFPMESFSTLFFPHQGREFLGSSLEWVGWSVLKKLYFRSVQKILFFPLIRTPSADLLLILLLPNWQVFC